MIVGHIGGGSAAGAPVYEIEKSLRFRASASAYINRTFSAPTDNRKWTWSGWVKRGGLGVLLDVMFSAGASNPNAIYFNENDALAVDGYYNGVRSLRATAAAFRDPSAWYHVVVVLDTTQATDSDRLKVFVNNVQYVLSTVVVGSWPAQNSSSVINSAVIHVHGRRNSVTDGYLDGYQTEINFIDGQALDPSYFGEFSTETGQWIPKKYTGTYGTNGFYLDFKEGSSLASLTADKSGNGNDWTATGISLTAGPTYDWMEDVPGNSFATLNPLHPGRSTLTNGNLTANGTTDTPTILPTSGTWYFERNGIAQTWTPPAAFPSGVGSYNFGQQPWQAAGPSVGQKILHQRELDAAGTVTVSGTFTGNAVADGPFVWMNGSPNTLTINGNAVTFGTHADRLANGFKVRTNSASYNAAGSNTWTATISSDLQNLFKYNNAKDNS